MLLFTVAFDHEFGTMDNADDALGQAYSNVVQVPSLASRLWDAFIC